MIVDDFGRGGEGEVTYSYVYYKVIDLHVSTKGGWEILAGGRGGGERKLPLE